MYHFNELYFVLLFKVLKKKPKKNDFSYGKKEAGSTSSLCRFQKCIYYLLK